MDDEEMHAYEDTFVDQIPEEYSDFLKTFEQRCQKKQISGSDTKWLFIQRLLVFCAIIAIFIGILYIWQ